MYSWHDMVKMMKCWIDENIDNIPPLQEMAKRLGYSYFYATKKFHEVEGITLKEYILISKLQHAANRLNTTSNKIIDIALENGYSSPEAFTRAFMKVYKISPSAYRNLKKPMPNSMKSRLLHSAGYTKSTGGIDMKTYVKQMYDWNYYAYYAEDVDEKYWSYFRDELWWQVGNGFIKTYDNVEHFEYCAENFTKYGEISIKQQLKLTPAPWEKALKLFIPEMKSLGVDWYIHGSTAMALWGIDVLPRNIDVIVANYSDFDKVKNHFCKFAVNPFQRCENWLMSGLGGIFLEANIGFAFHNKELEPYDMSKLEKIIYYGEDIYIETLEGLKKGNENYGRLDRVKLIEERIKNNKQILNSGKI